MVLKTNTARCPKEYMEAAAAGSYPLCVFNIKIIFTGAGSAGGGGGGGRKVNVAHRKTLGWR